ncbi:hypothetical protein GCM10010360_08740 [Streptomyces nogalater]
MVLAAYRDEHHIGAVHHLLVVGAHGDALEALGQSGGGAGSPGGEEDLRRRAASVAQALDHGPADLAHSDDADALHCVVLQGVTSLLSCGAWDP